MSKHVHRDAFHDSAYSQICACGAVRLRASKSRKWEPWHVCALCALTPSHETKHAQFEADKAFEAMREALRAICEHNSTPHPAMTEARAALALADKVKPGDSKSAARTGSAATAGKRPWKAAPS